MQQKKTSLSNYSKTICFSPNRLHSNACSPTSLFCTQVFEQISEPGSFWKAQLASDEAANLEYMLQKPSSDSTPQFFSFAKEKFGEDCEVQQCGGNHLSGKCFLGN